MKEINCTDLIDKKIIEFVNILNLDNCELLELFKLNKESSIVCNLGNEQESYNYHKLSNNKDNSKIEIWFKDKKIEKINIIKTWENLNLIKQQISLLEKPTKKLDYYFDVIKMKNAVWVYPKKGIAIFWGFENKAVYKISYFRPMTISKYVKLLHPIEIPREFEIE